MSGKMGNRSAAMRLSMRVWDAPTRLFHWAIVLLLIASYATQYTGHMEWHFLSGYTLLTLLLFRVVWGFVGSDTARFSRFLRSPLAGLAHLAAFGRREPDNEVGHNAAGGWMVMLLLAALLTQAISGLFAHDDDITEGPLHHLASPSVARWMDIVHYYDFTYAILGLVALHILAVAAYAVVERHNLVKPMLTGKKRLPASMKAPRMASPVLALLVLACAAGIVAVVVTDL